MATAQGPASVDDNIKVNLHQLQTMKSQLDVVKEFKSSVNTGMKDLGSSMKGFGKSFSKSFSLKSLGSKISDTFSKGIKGLTTPFKNLGGKISGAFSGLKSKIMSFSPIAAMKGLIGKLNPMKAVNKVLGRKKGEEAKEAFFNNWWNPAKVAVIQTKASAKYWEKYYKKKAKKEEKKNAKLGLSAGGEASQGQMFGAIVKAVNKIANAVSFFFAGPGLGIALAIGLVPPILILCAALVVVAYLICTTLEKLLTPVINLISDLIHFVMDELGEPIKTILNSVAGFIEMLVGKITALYEIVFDLYIGVLKPIQQVICDVFEVLGMISGFVKKIVGSFLGTALNIGAKVAGKIFGGNKEEKPEEDPSKMFVKMGQSIVDLKEYFTSGALANAITEGLKSLQDFAANISAFIEPITTAFDNLATHIRESIQSQTADLLSLMNIHFSHLFDTLDMLNRTISLAAAASIGNIFKSASDIFYNVKSKIKTAMGMELSEEEKKKENEQINPFSVLIEGFERMHKESIAILSEIKTSLLNIEKTKIQIGSVLNSTNTGEVADGKGTNALQTVTISNETNLDGVIEKMEETNKLLSGILTNTSINEEGIEKTGSVWSI